MHAFASTVLSFFLSPFHWILLFLVAGFIFRKKMVKRSCWISAVVIFLLFSNQWLLDWYANAWQPAPVKIPAGKVYSCGIVPGGFAGPDKDGDGNFNISSDRFIQALRLYKLGHITHILISGGNGKKELKTFREGAWVKNELVIMGVPDAVIYVEDQSNNTAENAVNSKKILDANKLPPPYLLISSAYHIPRAALLFEKNGVQTEPFPCNYIAGRGINTISALIPDFGVLSTWDFYLKETAGYLYYR